MEFEFEAPVADEAPELILPKKKKKKKKPKDPDSSDPPATNGAAVSEDPDAVPELVLPKKKKKKKKLPTSPEEDNPDVIEDVAASGSTFASLLAVDDADSRESQGEKEATLEENLAALEIDDVAPVPKKKKKKKRPPLKLDDEPVQDPPANVEPVSPPMEEKVEVRKPLTAAEKKKAKKEREKAAKKKKAADAAAKAAAENDDIDAIMASLDAVPATASNTPPKETVAAATSNAEIEDLLGELDAAPVHTAGKKNKKKKKKAAANTEADDIDALLMELGGDSAVPTAAATGSAAPNGGPARKEGGVAEVDDLLAELGEGEGEGEVKLTAAQKKKLKKKKKAAAAKTAADAGASKDGEAGPPGEAKTGKKKKESVAVRRMREQREKMAAAEEALRKAQEEEEARIAEEERLRKEAENKVAEQRAKKKAAEKARKERKRAEGLLFSKAEKERRRKAEIYRKQLLAQGKAPAAVVAGAAPDASAPGRPVYNNRRRKRNQAGGTVQAASAGVQTDTKENPSITEQAEVETGAEKLEQVPTIEKPVADDWEAVPEDWEKEAKPAENEEPAENASSEVQEEEKTPADVSSNEDASEDDDDSSDDDVSEASRISFLRAMEKKHADNKKARSPDNLRAPIICILGHVDTGKTKILDRIRRTNVQDGEAGGITQQIGATYFPIDAVKKETMKLPEGGTLAYNVPSLLIIDTPGHESFTNLRTRGSSLCDIAILVIDIMHGIEKQTMESINLLKQKKTPFIIALNKIDRMFDWQAQPNNCPTRESLSKQKKHTVQEFQTRLRETKLQLNEVGFNCELYWENDDLKKVVSLVPTSAITGEGIPDLLMLLLTLPQSLLVENLMFNASLQATVLEVKVIAGLGTSIDIILTGGTIHEGDTIMVAGLDGPILTTIRALLTPHPMKEMRVKGQYLRHKEVKAAQGIKISAEGLEKAIAGTQLVVVSDPENEHEVDYAENEVSRDMNTILENLNKSGAGVYVQASTLGSLEALLAFLKDSNIPVSGVNIGPVHKKDVKKCSAMLERQKEFATILAFDVKVEGEARELAEELGVRIFTADIIYHLFDQFTEYMAEVKRMRREDAEDDVVFPCTCTILPRHIYNTKEPIILGVDVSAGILRVGTPLVVRRGPKWLTIGRVSSIEANLKQVITARKGESVCIKINPSNKESENVMYGRHFDFKDELVSHMTRKAIDLLKENYRDDLAKEDWLLVIKMKNLFSIQ